MRKVSAVFSVSIVAVVSTVHLHNQSAPAVTLVKAGRLLIRVRANVLAPAAVLIQGDQIKQIAPRH
jgi:hypothetical protein